MTENQKALGTEIAVPFPAEDANSKLKRKLDACYNEYYESWLQMQPLDLVERAEEIASIRRMREELPDAVTEEDAAYLLRFKNPLEVVADAWQSMNGSGSIVDDDMTQILWEIRDRQDAEQDYEIEQGFFRKREPSYPELSL